MDILENITDINIEHNSIANKKMRELLIKLVILNTLKSFISDPYSHKCKKVKVILGDYLHMV